MSGTVRHVRTACLDIAYEDRGHARGSPIILIHGFPDDVRTWDAVVEALGEAGYRTLAPYVRGFGPTRFLDPTTFRAGQMAALGQDLLDFADALRIQRFAIVGHDWGARAAYVVAALWPERVRALVAISVPYGTSRPEGPISPAQAKAYWYHWYFHTERGHAVLENDRRALCRYLWETWSPNWKFDDQAFEATAQSFDNPDFVDVVIHYYRHRWGSAPGDPRYDALESRMAGPPPIRVSTTMLHGEADGAALPESSANTEQHFKGPYERRVIPIAGHFVQREEPEVVIHATLELLGAHR